MSRAETVRRATYLCVLAIVLATACRPDLLVRGEQAKALKDGVTRAESLAVKSRSRPSRTMLLDPGACTIDHWDPATVSGCAMPTPFVTPVVPWLQHSGGIYEDPQTDPISIKFPGPVRGVTVESFGALKCGGSSIGRMVGYRNGVAVESASNTLTDPSDCGEDDVTFGVSGALGSATAIDSLVIEGVDPWQFTVFGESGARALLNYTVTFEPMIDVNCSPSPLVRTDSITCTAAAAGGTLVITEWKFTPSDTSVSSVFESANPGPTIWAGRVAVSGKVEIEGSIDGAAAVGSTSFLVQPRTGWTSLKPTYIVDSIASALPVNPRSDSALGRTTFGAEVSDSGQAEILTGPNKGMWYLTKMYTELMSIEINYPALLPTSSFVLAHPTTEGEFCSRATVMGLAPHIAMHEGTTYQTNSHTFFFKRRMNTFSLGDTVESVLGENGGMSGDRIARRIKTWRDSALFSADSADTNGVNNMTLPCKLQYTY